MDAEIPMMAGQADRTEDALRIEHPEQTETLWCERGREQAWAFFAWATESAFSRFT